MDPGYHAGHRYSLCRELYPRQTKRSGGRTVSRDTARPRHASLNVHVRREQDASRHGDGAQRRSPTRPASTVSAKLWRRPRPWSGGTAEGRRTPLTVTQEPGRRATGTPALKTLYLLAPKLCGWKNEGRCWSTRASGNLPKAAALDRLSKPCGSNLQQEQTCLGHHSTGDIAASAASLWSSIPVSLAEWQPL